MFSQWSDIVQDLENQIIPLWTVVYNSNSDCVYNFFDWQHVLAGIDGSLRTYLDEGQKSEIAIKSIMIALQDCRNKPSITISLNQEQHPFVVDVYRWELDHHTKLFRVLNSCYGQVDDNTKIEIMSLFSNRG